MNLRLEGFRFQEYQLFHCSACCDLCYHKRLEKKANSEKHFEDWWRRWGRRGRGRSQKSRWTGCVTSSRFNEVMSGSISDMILSDQWKFAPFSWIRSRDGALKTRSVQIVLINWAYIWKLRQQQWGSEEKRQLLDTAESEEWIVLFRIIGWVNKVRA